MYQNQAVELQLPQHEGAIVELIVIGIGAGFLIVANIVRDLLTKRSHARLGSDPESERARRDIQRAKTLGNSHFVGLDNTGHRR